MSTAQERFDAQYVSSREIVARLKVSRPLIFKARQRGLLPDPIVVNGAIICLWERDKIEPYLTAWETMLKVRRAQ